MTVRITMSHPNLFMRTLKKAAVPAEAAVEAVPSVSSPGAIDYVPAVEAKEYVPFKPAEWDYRPWRNTTEIDTQNEEDFDSGIGLFEYWLTNEEGATELGDFFNILVERQISTYTVSYDKRISVSIDAETVAENNLTDTSDVESYVENNYDSLDEEDWGEISDISVSESDGDWVEIDWTG
jgi:hypothetical protein